MVASTLFAMTLLGFQEPKANPIGLALGIGNLQGEEAFLGAVREQIRLGVEQVNVSIKWQDLENGSPFTLKPLQDQLGLAKFIGADLHVTFTGINTNVRSMPPDLATLPLNHPRLQQKWEDALLQVARALPRNVRSISLGNEVDVYFQNHKDEIPAWNELMKTSRALLRGAGITCPVGVITTFDGARRHPELVKQLQAPWSVFMTTYYPLNEGFEVLPMAEVPKHFAALDSLAAGKDMYLTELGCPAGAANKSSEDVQAEFVAASFGEIRKRPQIKLASFFHQADYSTKMVDIFEIYYQLKDDRFRSFLGTLGLRDGDFKPRKAHAVFRKQLSGWLGS